VLGSRVLGAAGAGQRRREARSEEEAGTGRRRRDVRRRRRRWSRGSTRESEGILAAPGVGELGGAEAE